LLFAAASTPSGCGQPDGASNAMPAEAELGTRSEALTTDAGGPSLRSFAIYAQRRLRLGDGNLPDAKLPLVPRFFKLSDDVHVVPVVVISWDGRPRDVDYRDHAHALFDYHPFTSWDQNHDGGPWSVLPTGGFQTIDPEVHEPATPDDIWAQCGIQFQIVRMVRLSTKPDWVLPCTTFGATLEFTDNFGRDLREAIGPRELAVLDELDPVYVHFGDLDICANFYAKADSGGTHVHVNTERPRAPTTAHELGHILLGGGHYANAPNLMAEPLEAANTKLTEAQCRTARSEAQWFSERYRRYNRTVGRTPPIPTPVLEPYGSPPSVGDVPDGDVVSACCDLEGSLSITFAHACLLGGGSLRPIHECVECCLIRQSPPVELVRLGTCDPADVLPRDQCTWVCCNTGANWTSKYECVESGGTIVPCDQPPPT
jgi:hypothetical protein